MVTPDDCFRPLEQGIYNKLDVADRAAFSAKLRDWLKATRSERKRFKESGSGGLSIGSVSFNLAGDSAQWEELDNQFEQDSNLIINDDKFFQLSQRIVDSNLIDNYYQCLQSLAGKAAPALRLQADSANTSDITLGFKIVVGPDGDQQRSIKVKSVYVAGGKLENSAIAAGDILKSGVPATFFIARERLSNGEISETRIAIYTDHGSIGKLVPGRKAPPTPTPTPTPPPPPKMTYYKLVFVDHEHPGLWEVKKTDISLGSVREVRGIAIVRSSNRRFREDWCVPFNEGDWKVLERKEVAGDGNFKNGPSNWQAVAPYGLPALRQEWLGTMDDERWYLYHVEEK